MTMRINDEEIDDRRMIIVDMINEMVMTKITDEEVDDNRRWQ